MSIMHKKDSTFKVHKLVNFWDVSIRNIINRSYRNVKILTVHNHFGCFLSKILSSNLFSWRSTAPSLIKNSGSFCSWMGSGLALMGCLSRI